MNKWQTIANAPPGLVLDTKIQDKDGARMRQKLKFSGNLWFTPDGSGYVYYTPTHWRWPND